MSLNSFEAYHVVGKFKQNFFCNTWDTISVCNILYRKKVEKA